MEQLQARSSHAPGATLWTLGRPAGHPGYVETCFQICMILLHSPFKFSSRAESAGESRAQRERERERGERPGAFSSHTR